MHKLYSLSLHDHSIHTPTSFTTEVIHELWTAIHELWTYKCSSWFLEKEEEPEVKLQISAGSLKKKESSKKISISASLTMPKPLTVWITIKGRWTILKVMGIPDHLTCLLTNIYAGQEATARTGCGTTDWFQIGKGICQGCILSPCLFNLYAE